MNWKNIFKKAVKYYKPFYDNIVIEFKNNKLYEIFYADNNFCFVNFSIFPYLCPDYNEYEQIKEITKEEYIFELAKFISEKLHKNQVDKAGIDYFTGHIQTVVDSVKTNKEKIVAYLHDTVEDTNITIDKIYEIFGDEIGLAVEIITKTNNIDYFEYINKIKNNELARAVKIADLKHNMDLTRLKTVTEKDLKRYEKYKKALEILENYKE